jgi:phospholipid/cholesterol/gamma-HCH transport system substrate-binding protein
MSFRIGKFGVFREAGYDVIVSFDNASGLDPKSPVQIAGVQVGKVRKIKLDGYKAMATLVIKDNVNIPVDSKVAIKTQGVLGDKYIEIIPGVEKKFLAQGERIKDIVTSPDFDEIFTQINVAVKNFGDTVGEFKDIIGDKEKVNIKKSIDNIQALSGEFKDFLKDNKDNVARIVDNAATLSDGLQKIVSDIEGGKGTLGLLVKDDKLYNDARDAVASLKSISTDIEQGKGTLGKLAKDDSIYIEAKETVKNMREITDGIKSGEGTLGKLAKDDSLYIEAERTMKKLQKGAEGLQEMTPITILGTIFGTIF